MFDPKTKIWSGKKVPLLYHEEATYGEIVLHYLKRSPNDIIQVCEEDGIELTCDQLRIYSIRVAQNLKKFNISHGNVAGFVAQNTTYLTPVILGCLLQGVTFATIDPILNKDNIKHLFKDSKPDIVFCDHDLFEKTECGLRELNNKSKIISLTEKIDGVYHVSELLKETGSEDDYVPPRFGKAEDLIGAILCSSATTSLPKGICLSHSQLIDLLSFFETNHDDICFNFSPLYWISGVLMLSVSLGTGMKRVITNRLFNPEFALHLIEKHKITMLISPPPHIRSVVRLAKQRSANMSRVRMLITGAAVASDYLLETIKNLIPGAKIINSYGMTEAGGICLTEFGVGGKIAKNIQIKVIDENGNALAPNKKGLIMVYPEFKFLGYCNAPEKTDEIYIDGWIDTGDFGYIDEKEDVFVLDRAKELIKCGNDMVCLSDVEAVMEKIETLAESCVIGIPNKERNHVLAALVVKVPGSKLTEADIFKITEEILPSHQQLLGGIFFTNELPKTTSGKILRRIAREMIYEKIRENTNDKKRLSYDHANGTILPA